MFDWLFTALVIVLLVAALGRVLPRSFAQTLGTVLFLVFAAIAVGLACIAAVPLSGAATGDETYFLIFGAFLLCALAVYYLARLVRRLMAGKTALGSD